MKKKHKAAMQQNETAESSEAVNGDDKKENGIQMVL